MAMPKLGPGDKLTTEQIQKLEDQVRKNSERLAELQKIGTSPETPDEGELMTHGDRAKSGFAEDEAIVKMTQAGYTDMHRNKAGDWVAKSPDGRWYSDAHGPVSFLERHLGDLPGLVGMAGGAAAGTVAAGAAGAVAGAPGGPPGMAGGAAAYAPYGAVAGAGAGAAGGEALRQYIGQKLGVREAPISPADVAVEGALGAAGEGAPKALGKIPLGGGRNASQLLSQIADRYLVQPLKRGTAAVAGSLSGAGKEAALRVLERPDEMLAAGKNIDAKAAKAGDYLNFQDNVYGKDSGEARNLFRQNHGDKVVDTSKLLEKNASAMERLGPNKAGSGPLSQEDWDMLRQLQKEEYATARPVRDPVYGTDLGTEYVPEQTLGSLQKTADQLDKDVGPANWKRAAEDKPVQRTKAYISEAKKQRHDIKELLHMEDKNLARADKQYSDFARNAEPVANLSAPLKREKEYNAIAKAIAEGTETEKVAAAGRALPGHMDDLMDTGMNKRFTKDNLIDYLKPSPRRVLQMGLGAGSFAAGQANPEMEFGLGAGALLMEPAIIKQLLGRAAKAAPGAAAGAGRGVGLEGARSIWSLFNQEKKDGKE